MIYPYEAEAEAVTKVLCAMLPLPAGTVADVLTGWLVGLCRKHGSGYGYMRDLDWLKKVISDGVEVGVDVPTYVRQVPESAFKLSSFVWELNRMPPADRNDDTYCRHLVAVFIGLLEWEMACARSFHESPKSNGSVLRALLASIAAAGAMSPAVATCALAGVACP